MTLEERRAARAERAMARLRVTQEIEALQRAMRENQTRLSQLKKQEADMNRVEAERLQKTFKNRLVRELREMLNPGVFEELMDRVSADALDEEDEEWV